MIFRTLQKKYYLPIKYYFIIRKNAVGSKLRHQEDVYLKREQIKATLIEAERMQETDMIAIAKAKLELINWVLNKK